MDFFDSLDLDTTHNKCRRLRSWYLYEQYKSLEENQLGAAQRLKNKSYQDKILRQELQERRARRRLRDHFGICQSESRLEKLKSASSQAPLSASTDDLFESFCELHEELELNDVEDNFSHDGSQTSTNFYEFRSVDNKKDHSDNESFKSVIKNDKSSANLADDVKGELEIVRKNIVENINLQLATVKENIQCLEKYTKLDDDDKIIVPENSSSNLFEQCKSDINAISAHKKFNIANEKKYFATWSKLVAFACKTVQLNHGNFYNDYSSQLMIAVLVFDVLRRGITKMCHILQPFISPIKYATSDSDISVKSCKCDKRKTDYTKNCPKTFENAKHHSCNSIKSSRKLRWNLDRDYQSENKWHEHSKYSFDNRLNEMKQRRASEPWYNRGKKFSRKPNSSTWPEKFSEESVCKCRSLKNIGNSILQLAQCVESIL